MQYWTSYYITFDYTTQGCPIKGKIKILLVFPIVRVVTYVTLNILTRPPQFSVILADSSEARTTWDNFSYYQLNPQLTHCVAPVWIRRNKRPDTLSLSLSLASIMYYIWVRLTKINMCANKQLIFEKFVQVHPAYVLPGFLVNSGISKNSDYSLLLGTKAGLFFYPFHRNCWIFLLRQLSFLVSYYPIWLGTLSTVRILNFSCTIVQKKIIKNIW